MQELIIVAGLFLAIGLLSWNLSPNQKNKNSIGSADAEFVDFNNPQPWNTGDWEDGDYAGDSDCYGDGGCDGGD